MDQILYKHRGGYRVTGKLSLNATGNGGTWPLSQLILRDSNLSFKFLRNQYDFQYSDIDHIEITKSGFIVFIIKDSDKSFSFTSLGLRKIVNILQQKQVAISPEELPKLNSASASITAQFVFMAAFLIFMIIAFLGFHHIGPMAHVKFRGQPQ